MVIYVYRASFIGYKKLIKNQSTEVPTGVDFIYNYLISNQRYVILHDK